ncbi:MAG TPA: ATP-binding protein, partial [Cyclobacteriaceae bacterium]
VVSIGLLMVLTLVVIIFRNRQRYQKQLKEIELNAKIRQEKERIAQDLHDNIGTQLTMVASELNKLSREPIFNSDQVKHLHQNMNATLVELRDTIWAINKDEVSLEEIENRINNLFWRLRQNDDSVNFQLKTVDTAAKQKLSPAEAVNLFRIIQEAINNSLKHSKATEVTVILERKSNQIHLTVSDNGVGFLLEETEQIEHYGMGNMKKRAKEIDAHFSLTSKPGVGTFIQLQLNLLQSG